MTWVIRHLIWVTVSVSCWIWDLVQYFARYFTGTLGSCRSELYLLVALYHIWVMPLYGCLLPVLGRWSLLESEMRAREIVREVAREVIRG